MSKELSLFNDYRTKENILTNHSGLILKLLFEENPRGFEEVISNLAGIDFSITPTFGQQKKKLNSTPDLTIEQPSFSIFFETKTHDWFTESQIQRHISGFKSTHHYKILFLLSNFQEDQPDEKFSDLIEEAFLNKGVRVVPITFVQLIGVIETVDFSTNYKNYLEEYRAYLERNDFLPTWKYMLDVVNCASTIHEVYEGNIYMCPNTGGKYKHKRALYFGGYKDKNVKYIHEILALVVVEKGGKDGVLVWKNNTEREESELIKLAKTQVIKFRAHEIEERDLQVFLLANAYLANFRKSSSGGLYSSKKYFETIARDCGANNSRELAEYLKEKTWEQV